MFSSAASSIRDWNSSVMHCPVMGTEQVRAQQGEVDQHVNKVFCVQRLYRCLHCIPGIRSIDRCRTNINCGSAAQGQHLDPVGFTSCTRVRSLLIMVESFSLLLLDRAWLSGGLSAQMCTVPA